MMISVGIGLRIANTFRASVSLASFWCSRNMGRIVVVDVVTGFIASFTTNTSPIVCVFLQKAVVTTLVFQLRLSLALSLSCSTRLLHLVSFALAVHQRVLGTPREV